MYQFNQYFDIEKQGLPYAAPHEELEDYLRLLDMLLESYLEFKGLSREEKLFSRGLVITESEMTGYFKMPPYLRERDIGDQELAQSAESAFEYIEERVRQTLFAIDPSLYEDDEDDADENDADLFLGSAEDDADLPGFDSANLDRTATNPINSESAAPYPTEQNPAGEADSETDPTISNPAVSIPADEGAGEASFEADSDSILSLLRIDFVRQLFDLSRTELMAVILALAPEIDRRYERIYGFLQDNIASYRPTTGLLHALISRITIRLSPQPVLPEPLSKKMFTWFFKSTEENDDLRAELILHPLMKQILLGEPETRSTVSDVYYEYKEEDIPLFFEDSGAELAFAISDESNSLCYLECDDEETVLHLLYRYCADHGEQLYVLNLSDFSELAPEDGQAVLSELLLKVKLQGARLCVRYRTDDDKESESAKKEALRRWKALSLLSEPLPGECIALYGEKEEPGELIIRSVPFIHIPMPCVTLRMSIWDHFMQEADGIRLAEEVKLPDLADCYDVTYGTIKSTCSHARSAAKIQRTDRISRAMILEALRQLNQVDFSGLATYVKPAYRWEDITITDTQREVLRIACDRYRLRNRVGTEWGLTRKNAYGNGVSLLLYGPPGTGKTMAAQIVANELGLPLYRVDISQIFSKYIGETEKNLSLIFDAAKGSNVILFFDEADALFSKRTEISSSNDKYSNSETAYLLQKVEEYNGMSILATNLYSNFDTAFVRRLTYSVRLDNPDEAARYILWTTILPRETQVSEELDFHFLAKHFDLSGSNIKSILYSAAYMAGAEQSPVGPRHVVRAMELEYQKLGRFIDPSAFKSYAKYLSVRGHA